MNSQPRKGERGSVLVLAVVILAVASSVSGAAVLTAALGQKIVRNDVVREKAYRIAESGVEKAIVELAADAEFAGESDVAFDTGSFSTNVLSIGENERQITSTGQARKGASILFRHRIVARVSLGPDQVRIVRWSESSLPIQQTTTRE